MKKLRDLVLTLALACACIPALAQQNPVPPALGEPAEDALAQARQEIAQAAALLKGDGGLNPGEALAATLRHVLDARGALEQAITSGKAAGGVPDTVTDRLDRAIDGMNEVARTLRQMDPPVPQASRDAMLGHLDDAMLRIHAAAGRLEPLGG